MSQGLQKGSSTCTVTQQQFPEPKQIQPGKYGGRGKWVVHSRTEKILDKEVTREKGQEALQGEFLGFLRDCNHLTEKCALGLVAFLLLCSDTLPLQGLQGNPSQACYL